MRSVLWLAMGICLGGCATVPIVNTRGLPAADWPQVRDAYQAAADHTVDPSLRLYSRRRLADLILERSEDGRLDTDAQAEGALERVAEADGTVYRESIAFYEAILRDTPSLRDKDRVMYQLARAYDMTGQPQQTLRVLTQLAQEYPQSDVIGEVQFRRGELFYTARNYPDATRAYQAATARGEGGRFYRSALYKLGWSELVQGHNGQAEQAFYRLLDLLGLREELATLPVNEQELAQDALRGLSISYSRQPDLAGLTAQKVLSAKRPYLFLVYQALALQALQKQDDIGAARAYRTFITDYPSHAQAPWFLLEEINLHEAYGRPMEGLTLRAELYQRYRRDSGYWEYQSEAQWARFMPKLRENVRYLARYYHAEGQRHWNADDWRQAQHWYQAYIRAFPGDPTTPEINFMFAESYFDAGNYVDAVVEFERTAYKYPPHARSAEAGYAALQVLQQRFDLSPDARRTAQLASMQRFVASFQQDTRWPQVMSRMAEMQYGAGFYAAASATAHVALQYPQRFDSVQILNCYALITLSEMELANFELAERMARHAIEIAPAASADPAQERLATVIYRQGEHALRQGDWRQALKHYLRVPKQVLKVYPAALFDAAVVTLEYLDHEQAMVLFEQILTLEADPALIQVARERLADIYLRTQRRIGEAEQSELLALQSADEQQLRYWLLRAANAYAAGRDKEKAMALYWQLINRYDETTPQTEARYRLAEMYRERNDNEQRQIQLQRILRSRAGIAGEPGQTLYLGLALLDAGDIEAKAFQRMPLSAPLENTLRDKKQRMQAALQLYNQAAELALAEVATAATYKSAMLFREFARVLLASERPARLGGEELEVYQLMLEEQAFPLEQRAISLFETNIKRAERGRSDEWVELSYQALHEMVPKRYPRRVVSDKRTFTR